MNSRLARTSSAEGILKGMYLLRESKSAAKLRVQLMGSGTILRESVAARELLDTEWGVAATVWSCPSFNELARDGQAVDRHNLLHPEAPAQSAFVTRQLQDLIARGHQLDIINDSYQDFGAGQFIWRMGDPAVEGYMAASDPRRDGQAVGF